MKLIEWYLERLQDLLSVLSPVPEFSISLARAQLEERRERRERLDRDTASDGDSQECIARVRRRMVEGDTNWIPPRYNADVKYREWRRTHRRHVSTVANIAAGRREA